MVDLWTPGRSSSRTSSSTDRDFSSSPPQLPAHKRGVLYRNAAVMTRTLHLLTTVTALLGLQACARDAHPTLVDASLGEGAPAPALEISFLPFDPQALLDSLANASGIPRPAFEALEASLAAYRAPDEAALAAAAAPWRTLRDSLTTITDSLNTLARGSPPYARLFRQFRQMQPRLAPLAAQRDSAVGGILAEHRRLAERATTAAESLRSWEEVVYAPYPEVSELALRREGRSAVAIETDSTGAAEIHLERGRWWAVARVPDPENPFLEYAWTVPFTVTGWLPVQLPLMPRNARRRWRH